jgi:hypothetical protein
MLEKLEVCSVLKRVVASPEYGGYTVRFLMVKRAKNTLP